MVAATFSRSQEDATGDGWQGGWTGQGRGWRSGQGASLPGPALIHQAINVDRLHIALKLLAKPLLTMALCRRNIRIQDRRPIMTDQAVRNTSVTDTAFAVGQTWRAVSDDRQIELITQNAEGAALIGYLGEAGTGLATETQFAEWVREEVATQD